MALAWVKAVCLLIASVQAVLGASCFATIYEADPIRSGLSFPNGTYSTIYKGFLPYTTGIDIAFTGEGIGRLQLANEGDRVASYVDLGSQQNVTKRFGISGPVSSAYLSIHVDERGYFLLAKNTSSKQFQPIDPAILSPLQLVEKAPVFEPKLDHIYIINITDTTDPSFNRVAKLLVANWLPPTADTSPYITLRWDVLIESRYDHGKWDICHILADEPIDESQPRTPNKPKETPEWVVMCLIALFVLSGVEFAIIVATIIWAKGRRPLYAEIR